MKNRKTEKTPETETGKNPEIPGKEKAGLDVLEISGSFYVVSYDGSPRGFSIVDGPFAERHWAVSQARLNEM